MRQDSPLNILLFLEDALLITNPRGKLLLDKSSRCAWHDEALPVTPELPLNCGNLNSPAWQSPPWTNVYRHAVNRMVKLLTQLRSHHQTSHQYRICQGYTAVGSTDSRTFSHSTEQQGYGPGVGLETTLSWCLNISLQLIHWDGNPGMGAISGISAGSENCCRK